MLKIVLATTNKGKIREIKAYLRDFEVVSFDELMPSVEVEENGTTFKENALIKAREIYRLLGDKNAVVLSDDSGITVPALGNIPDIYSARFAGVGASARDNLLKLIDELRKANLKTAGAYYTGAIALVGSFGEYCVHGWMHGSVIDEELGSNGFGYDPMFVPDGESRTLAQMEANEKEAISHRTQALDHALVILKTLNKG